MQKKAGPLVLTWNADLSSSPETTHTLLLLKLRGKEYALQKQFGRRGTHVATISVKMTKLCLLQEIAIRAHYVPCNKDIVLFCDTSECL